MHECLFACQLWCLLWASLPAYLLYASCHKRCLLAYEFHAIHSLFLLRSSVHSTLPCLLVGRHVYCGLFKGITFFSSNACVAAFCELASVGIGHSKNVIGLNSLIRTTVAWDWFAEQVTLRFLFDAKEDITGFFEGLALWLSQIDAGWSIVIESGCVLCEMLLIDDWVILIIVASVEFPDGHWIDWLLQIWSAFQIDKAKIVILTIFLTFLYVSSPRMTPTVVATVSCCVFAWS